MKRRSFPHIFLIAFVLLLVPWLADCKQKESGQVKNAPGIRTIYIDPWYNTKETGEPANQDQYAKDVTLTISRELQTMLEAAGFRAVLSRKDKKVQTLDQRCSESRAISADIYLGINVSRRGQDCVRIFFPALPNGADQTATKNTRTMNKAELHTELGRIVKDLARDEKIESSLRIGAEIVKRMRRDKYVPCADLLKRKHYILETAAMPALIIDFGVSYLASEPYILDSSKTGQIIRSVVETIKEYSAGIPSVIIDG